MRPARASGATAPGRQLPASLLRTTGSGTPTKGSSRSVRSVAEVLLSELIEDPARESNIGIGTGKNHQFRLESPALFDVIAHASTDVEIQIRGAALSREIRSQNVAR